MAIITKEVPARDLKLNKVPAVGWRFARPNLQETTRDSGVGFRFTAPNLQETTRDSGVGFRFTAPNLQEVGILFLRKSLIAIILLVGQSALAQVPIDPLRLPGEETGNYTYTFTVNYTPDGREGADLDGEGFPFNFTTFGQSINFSASGSYTFSRHISIAANFNPNIFVTTEKRDFEDRTERVTRTDSDMGGGLSLEYRPAPGSTLDPRLSVGVAYPWTATVQGQVSLIRDPVILLTSLGYTDSLESADGSLNLGLGFGFVANDRVSFSGFANYGIPVGDTDLPFTSISFLTGYSLDNRGSRDIGVRTTLSTRGGDTRVGISAEFGGRGTIGGAIENTVSTSNTNPNNRNTALGDRNSESSVNSQAVNLPANDPADNISPNPVTSRRQLPPANSGASSQSNLSNSNTTTNAVPAENTDAALEQLDRRLQEKDAQIEVLQSQIAQLQRSIETLQCQFPESQELCQQDSPPPQLAATSNKVRSSQARSSQGRSSQGRSSQGRSSQARSSQARSSQARSSQARSSQARSSQARSSQARSSQARSSQTRSSQARSSQARSSQARSNVKNTFLLVE